MCSSRRLYAASQRGASKDTGQLCIALLKLDLQSSGEHCGTDFLIRYGCINQFEEEMLGKVRKFLHDTCGAYEYGYTTTLTDDILVDKAKLPADVRQSLQSEEPDRSDGKER